MRVLQAGFMHWDLAPCKQREETCKLLRESGGQTIMKKTLPNDPALCQAPIPPRDGSKNLLYTQSEFEEALTRRSGICTRARGICTRRFAISRVGLSKVTAQAIAKSTTESTATRD